MADKMADLRAAGRAMLDRVAALYAGDDGPEGRALVCIIAEGYQVLDGPDLAPEDVEALALRIEVAAEQVWAAKASEADALRDLARRAREAGLAHVSELGDLPPRATPWPPTHGPAPEP
jgi:hypothetical protein